MMDTVANLLDKGVSHVSRTGSGMQNSRARDFEFPYQEEWRARAANLFVKTVDVPLFSAASVMGREESNDDSAAHNPTLLPWLRLELGGPGGPGCRGRASRARPGTGSRARCGRSPARGPPAGRPCRWGGRRRSARRRSHRSPRPGRPRPPRPRRSRSRGRSRRRWAVGCRHSWLIRGWSVLVRDSVIRSDPSGGSWSRPGRRRR